MGFPFLPLECGDYIDVIAPGSLHDPTVISRVECFLHSWGVRSRFSDNLFGEDPFYANTTSKRLSCLREAFLSKDASIIWSLRGGYGSTRLLRGLEGFTPAREKVLIGFSDVTALHLNLYRQEGWTCLHGPNLGQLAEGRVDEQSHQAIKDLLFGGVMPSYPPLIPLNDRAEKLGELRAPLVGGNASLIQYSIGTPWQLDTKGAFLFLEDVDERPYRTLERLEHMHQAGLFQHVKGIFLFDFSFNGLTNEKEEELYALAFQQFAQEVTVPVFKGTGVGHTRHNLPMILGKTVILKNANLSYEP